MMPGPGGRLAEGHGGHAVEFYGDDQELAVSAARFLGEGLAAGGSAVVVATAEHRLALQACLPSATGDGRLVAVDAGEMLHSFLVGGRLDGSRFREAADGLIGRAAGAGRPVRIYAEMVALLWDAGQVALALELEALWNGLAARLPFALLCGYPARLLAADDDQEAAGVQHVCHLHTAVAGPSPGPDGNGRSGAVCRFPGDLASAREARHFVVAALGPRAQGAGGADAAITAGELAANAVRHARSPFTVTVSCLPRRVRISVQDQAPLNGVPLAARPGHGLHMVAQVAARWAVEPLPGGKVIWAELPAPAPEGELRHSRLYTRGEQQGSGACHRLPAAPLGVGFGRQPGLRRGDLGASAGKEVPDFAAVSGLVHVIQGSRWSRREGGQGLWCTQQ